MIPTSPPASPAADRVQQSPRAAMSPLVPVLAPIAVAAIALGLVFPRLFPSAPRGTVAPLGRFTDVTREAGLAAPREEVPPDLQETPTTLPGAAAFLDYDNDGHPDLFLVGRPAWPWERPGAGTACTLYHNDGRGHFTDVSRAAGVDLRLAGMGVAVGDYDGDGYPDIFIAGVGGSRLLHNRGDGTFADVTAAAGVGGDDHVWSSAAVWIDLYGDGKLDLVVCNYARWSRETTLEQAFSAQVSGPSYTSHSGFVSAFPTVYRNLGGGRFADVTARTGLDVIDRQTGFPRAGPLAVAAVDANGDGRLDLLFTYQSGPDVLFLNQGDGTFRQWTGGSPDRREGAFAGLVAGGALALPRQGQAAGRFGILRAAGLAMSPAPEADDAACHLGDKLGVVLLDYDLDGRIDVLSGEGLAEPALASFEHGREFAAAPRLLWNTGEGWVSAAGAPGRPPVAGPLVARGLAAADVFGNGRLAVLITQNGGPPHLLRNDADLHNSWLRVSLVGTHCQRDAGGARVEVHTPTGVLVQTMEPAMGFMAQSETTLTFGLGADDRVRKVLVRWPSGLRQEVRVTGVDRTVIITEPE